METRIALVGIIVEDRSSSEKLNGVLHQYGDFIIGRMGLPQVRPGVSVISVVLDAPENEISALSGKLGMIPGVQSRVLFTKTNEQ